MAPERYVLGELTPEDRDAFEDHFFGCAECATAVRDASKIRAAIRVDAANRTRQPRPSVWWMAAAAVAVLVIGVYALQNIRLRQELNALRAPHIVDSVSFLTAGSRGGDEIVVSSASRPFAVDFDIPPQPNARRYVVRVIDAAGHVHAAEVVSAGAAANTQHLFFPARSLRPGRYSLEVHTEPPGSAATAWSFEVR